MKVRGGFGLLLGLRWKDGPRIAVPFTVSFAGPRRRIGHGTAQRGIAELVERKVIRIAQLVENPRRRFLPDMPLPEMRLYVPGGDAFADVGDR